jgi:hypothetical protein
VWSVNEWIDEWTVWWKLGSTQCARKTFLICFIVVIGTCWIKLWLFLYSYRPNLCSYVNISLHNFLFNVTYTLENWENEENIKELYTLRRKIKEFRVVFLK